MDSLALLKAGFQSIQWTAAHKWKATTALTVAVALLALAALTVLPQPERNPYGMHEVVAVEEDAKDEREAEGQAVRLRQRSGAQRLPRGKLSRRGRPDRADGRRAGLSLRDLQLPDEQFPHRGLCEGDKGMGFAPFGIGLRMELLTLTAYACYAAGDDRD